MSAERHTERANVGTPCTAEVMIFAPRCQNLPMGIPPLRFEPIFQYRLWGGRRLSRWSRAPLPGDEPIGEAWILSDRDDHASRVAEGPYAGQTLRDLFRTHSESMLGAQAGQFERFPLLLKFLDAAEMLSVQVHPSDAHKDLLPPGERGKTESWLVLDAEPSSRIYAGLQPGVTPDEMRARSADGTVEQNLASFHPEPGDGLFIEAGTVHALGGGVVVFETQQNSDVTFRLFDWNRVDEKTGQSRDLHIEPAIQSTNFDAVALKPAVPTILEREPALRERMFACEFFTVDRQSGDRPFTAGAPNALRVLVALDGEAAFRHEGVDYAVRPGDVYVLPASVGPVEITPNGKVTIAEVAVP
ncbi:MAG: type I phosphomannose isomerase catalytic subunit [Fimbriimonas sp.]